MGGVWAKAAKAAAAELQQAVRSPRRWLVSEAAQSEFLGLVLSLARAIRQVDFIAKKGCSLKHKARV